MYELNHLTSWDRRSNVYTYKGLYKVILEEREVFWEVSVSVILRKSSDELASKYEWLSRRCYLNLPIKKYCEWQ